MRNDVAQNYGAKFWRFGQKADRGHDGQSKNPQHCQLLPDTIPRLIAVLFVAYFMKSVPPNCQDILMRDIVSLKSPLKKRPLRFCSTGLPLSWNSAVWVSRTPKPWEYSPSAHPYRQTGKTSSTFPFLIP